MRPTHTVTSPGESAAAISKARPLRAAARPLGLLAALVLLAFPLSTVSPQGAVAGAATAVPATATVPAAGSTVARGSPGAAAEGSDTASGQEQSVTLQMARALAVENSAALEKAMLGIDVARLAEKSQSYAFLPSVSADASAAFAYGSTTSSSSTLAGGLSASAGLDVTQKLYDGGASAILVAIDSLSTGVARAAARAEYFALIQSCDDAFYTALEAEASVAAARTALGSAQVHRDLAQARFDSGAIGRTDLLQAQATAAADESALATALEALAIARAKLASLTGLPESAALAEVDASRAEALMARLGGLSTGQVEAFAAKLLALAEKSNPTLIQAQLTGGKAERSIATARSGYLPTVAATWSNTLAYAAASGSPPGSGSLSLTATIPLDLWATKTAVDSATLSARQARLDVDETRRTLSLDLRSAVYDCVALARAFASSSKALEYATSNYEGVLERYRLSAASSSDLSDAEALVSSDRTLLITARYAFLMGISSLRGYTAAESDAAVEEAVP